MNSRFVSVCDPSYFSSRLERNALELGIKLNKLAAGQICLAAANPREFFVTRPYVRTNMLSNIMHVFFIKLE